MSIFPELDDLDLEQLIACFRNVPPSEEGYEDIYLQEVAFRYPAAGPAGEQLPVG
jgi:hypothetical protein